MNWTISSMDVSKNTIKPIKIPAVYTREDPRSVKMSDNALKRLWPTTPVRSSAEEERTRSKNPIVTLGRDKNILSLKNKNPANIKINGTKI